MVGIPTSEATNNCCAFGSPPRSRSLRRVPGRVVMGLSDQGVEFGGGLFVVVHDSHLAVSGKQVFPINILGLLLLGI